MPPCVQVWTLDAPASTAAPAEGAPAAATATQRAQLQDERSSRRNAAAMLWLKAALVLLLAAAVAISGSLSYTLGACARTYAPSSQPSDDGNPRTLSAFETRAQATPRSCGRCGARSTPLAAPCRRASKTC
jgi:hypothetical protein